MKRTQKFADITRMRNPGCVELDKKSPFKNLGKVNRAFLFTVSGIGAAALVTGFFIGRGVK